MLQIASGKLFAGRPYRTNQLRGVAYTNLQLVGDTSIDTVAGTLVPAGAPSRPAPLVYEFSENIEGDGPPQAGTLISHTVQPYLHDFSIIVSFALNVTCTSSMDLTLRLTSNQPEYPVRINPRSLIQRVYDESVWCTPDDTTHIVNFVDALIGLERKAFLAAMRSIRTYITGLHRLADDPELSYTLLVASIESLAQSFDGHVAIWQDYAEDKRKRLDAALENADDVTAARVRETILEIEHVALSRRFVDFALKHVGPSYFREGASKMINPASRPELKEALKQAYQLRSRHIHSLVSLPDLLKLPVGYREVVSIERRPVLTFQGLARLARHVITEFVGNEAKCETEDYDYSTERAGIVYVPLAPAHWMWNTDNLTPDSGRKWLEGFMDEVAACTPGGSGDGITDLGNAILEAERLLPMIGQAQRRPYIALYLLYNELVEQQNVTDRYEQVRDTYEVELAGPSIEAMLVSLFRGELPRWELAQHRQMHDQAVAGLSKPRGMKIPQIVCASMSLALAERYRVAGQFGEAKKLMAAAVESCPGQAALCALEQAMDADTPIAWPLEVSGAHTVPVSAGTHLAAGRAVLSGNVSTDL